MAPCQTEASPDSFDPETQWVWPAVDPGPGELRYVYATPLVGNLTDDDDNGSIDLCDVPDVLIVAHRAWNGADTAGALVILDGATGAEHLVLEDAADLSVTPALGDIDADGVMEIVTVDLQKRVVAYEVDGTVAWTSDPLFPRALGAYGLAIALADLDADGDVEIIAGPYVLSSTGTVEWTMPNAGMENTYWAAHTAADLDGDGAMEVIAGHSAWRYDGTPYWSQVDVFTVDQPALHEGFPVYPAVADFDDDPEPEVLVTGVNGISVFEHDGATKFVGSAPIDPPMIPFAGDTSWLRPPTVHNFDGDSDAEVATSSDDRYSAFDIAGVGALVLWTANIQDLSGAAAGTAFDFLGDGSAEAMYGDEQTMWAFDESGGVVLQFARSSGTLIEYPVVADIDNDGSAEVLITSSAYSGDGTEPGVRAVRDAEDRWVPARRIWNQHTYHVTNVREDGTIPQNEPHHWEMLNTFRTQAQLEEGGACDPAG